MPRPWPALAAALAFAAHLGCSSDTSPAQACTPGQQLTCSCPSGLTGSQVCVSDGSGYASCSCSGASAGGAGGAGSSLGAAGAGDVTGGTGGSSPCVGASTPCAANDDCCSGVCGNLGTCQ